MSWPALNQYPAAASHPNQNPDTDTNKNADPDANNCTFANDHTFADKFSQENGETCAGTKTDGIFGLITASFQGKLDNTPIRVSANQMAIRRLSIVGVR